MHEEDLSQFSLHFTGNETFKMNRILLNKLLEVSASFVRSIDPKSC